MRAFFVFCLSLTLPGGKTRRVRKPPVFIRFDVHAVKAGINLRGCGPLTTLGAFGGKKAVSALYIRSGA